MQDYRTAWQSGEQSKLDAWAKEWDGRVLNDAGDLVEPCVVMADINKTVNRLSARQRKNFEADVNYLSEDMRAAA